MSLLRGQVSSVFDKQQKNNGPRRTKTKLKVWVLFASYTFFANNNML